LIGFQLCNKIITISDYLSDEAKEIARELRFFDLQKLSRKLITIHNGLNADEYYKTNDTSDFRKKYGIDQNAVIIGTALRIEPQKSLGYLLKVANILKEKNVNFKLIIVGEGYEKEQLNDLRQELKLEKHVDFLGFWEKERMPEFYSVLDIFVLPSLSEGLGNVNLEAMASFLPVVSTNVGGVPEVLRDNITGLLVRPGDECELADALIYLIQNPNIAKEMGRRGREIVENKFRKEETLNRIISLYR
jgi:glycosyltransferase involved in cell wall biosynthesis